MPLHFPKDSLLTRDISRPLTRSLALASILLVVTFGYYAGLSGALAALGYLGGIGLLLAIYLTYRRQWPRFLRYLRELWRGY